MLTESTVDPLTTHIRFFDASALDDVAGGQDGSRRSRRITRTSAGGCSVVSGRWRRTKGAVQLLTDILFQDTTIRRKSHPKRPVLEPEEDLNKGGG